ncbi:universal stress protein [Sorangium sp. So ce542]|uniref:universal stress protein n=1 Tax=Sorangium sp. So ce542 TaxID=3133316 RepID=UPI003F61D79F
MTESLKTPRAGEGQREMGEAERFHSLLVPVDLTAISDRVIGRVARLPLADGARVTLLHVVPGNLPVRAQDRAERDARKSLVNEARHLAKALPRGVHVEPVVKVGSSVAEIADCATSTRAELIVMGRGGSRALRDTFLGSTAERVIRRGQLPVLAVRLAPRAAYSRPAVALDLEQGSTEVLALMLRLIPAPRPRVTVIHAFDTPYRGAVYPSLTEEDAEEWRNELGQTAAQQIAKLLAASLARAEVPPAEAPPWKTHVRCGSARLVIEKAVKKADSDLLVLGTHGYSGVAHVLLGTVAGDVLREVACDVLVVPARPAAEEPG